MADPRKVIENGSLHRGALRRGFFALGELGVAVREKALNVFLPWHDQPFRKTHNLVGSTEAAGSGREVYRPVLSPLAQEVWPQP